MGWLNKHFPIECPYFGTITSDSDQTLYFKYIYFSPLNTEIELYIESNSFGPTKQQYLLFKDIEQHYFQYTQTLPELIEEVFRKERPAFKITDFTKEFKLTSLRILRSDKLPLHWHADFEIINNSDRFITIELIDKEPKYAYFNE